MSKYTTEVRYICEEYAGLDKSADYMDMNAVIAKARDKVFDFDFPIYDESYRSVLETKIIKHYYTREIGMETVSAWKRFLDMRLNEIMPYYNQLYKSATLEFNPLYDTDISTTGNRKNNGTEKNNSTSTTTNDLHNNTTAESTRTDNLHTGTTENATRTDNLHTGTTENATRTDDLANSSHSNSSENNRQRYSDTPQGSLENIETDAYLTNATLTDSAATVDSNGTNTGTVKNNRSEDVDNTGTVKNNRSEDVDNTGTVKYNNTSNSSNTGTVGNTGNANKDYTNTGEYIEHVIGKRGAESYASLLTQYRQTFINIDMMIIEELGDLFLNLW